MNLEKYIVMLFALLLPMNYLGRSLFSIDLLLILFLFILLIMKYKIKFTPIKKLHFLTIVVLFYCVLLIINFINPTHSYTENIKLLVYLPIVLYIANYIFTISQFKEANFLLFQTLFFYFVSFISLLVVLSFISGVNIIYTIKYFKIIEFEHSVFHSRQNLFAACIAFYLSYYFNNKTKMNLFLLSLIYLGVFASHGRTAIFVISVGTAIYLSYNMYQKKEFDTQKIYALFAICFVSLLLVLYISGSSLGQLNIHTSDRLDGWLIYLKLILEKNTIFGYGLQGGEYVYNSRLLNFKHPHNVFVESLFYFGIVGLFSFISVISLYAYSVFKNNSKIYDKTLMVAFFISVLLMTQGIGSLLGANNIVPLVLMIYLSMNAPANQK